MASRSTFGRNLVARARRIGWQVDNLSSGGWVITCADNFRVQVHTTPSDVNAEQTIMRELNNHGFTKAIEEFDRLDEEKRQERLMAAREENLRRLDAAQKQADALARAAGQVRVPEEILLNPYPVPKTFERVLVTAELAQKLLGLNTGNRPIRGSEVDLWKEVIERGAWHYTHQGIAIDSDGVLQDGQHRLSAVVLSTIPVEMQISVGMPPENFNAIDNGLRRTFGDVAARLGIGSHSKVGSVARLVIIYNEYPLRQFNSKVNNAEVADFLIQKFDNTGLTTGEMVHQAVNEGQMHWHDYRINSSAMSTLVFKLWETFGQSDPKVNEFLEGARSGVELGKEDPRLALRRVVSSPTNNSPRTATNHLGLALKAWNRFIQEKPVKVLAFRPKVEDMPKIFIPGVSDRKRG